MKKKKYLYLLLLLILPIIFFGVAEISLNSGDSKIETKGDILEQDDTLAATSFTYFSCKKCLEYSVVAGTKDEEKSIKWYENDKTALATWYMTHYVKCGTVQKEAQEYCYTTGAGFTVNIYNAKNNCSSPSKAHNSNVEIAGEECTQQTAESCSKIPVEICSKYSNSCKEGVYRCETKTTPKTSFNVYFDAGTGKFSESSGYLYNASKSVAYKSCTVSSCKVDAPTPKERFLYKFIGYCMNEDKDQEHCTTKWIPYGQGRGLTYTSDTIYYAQWVRYEYLVSFANSIDIPLTIDGETYYHCSVNGCEVTAPKIILNDDSGYKFIGWSRNWQCDNIEYDPSVSNIILYASDFSDEKDIFYFWSCFEKKSTGGSPSNPVTPIVTPTPTTETINATTYAKANASAGGYTVSCGDEVYVTTCETATSSSNPTCIVTKVNGASLNTTTKVYRKQLVDNYSDLPASCQNQTRYVLKDTSFYDSVSSIGKDTKDKVSCGDAITITGKVTDACSYEDSTYCKVTYNGKEGYVYRKNLTPTQFDKTTCQSSGETDDTEAKCYYNKDDKEYIWSKEDLSDKYVIEASASTEDECNALNGDGEKNCETSSKQTDVKDTGKKVKICYEKKNNKIVDSTDVMDMFSCAKDYTQNPVEQTENTCDNVKNGTCHKTYLVSCSNGTRPAIEISASLLNAATQGKGTITIKGRKIANDIKSYYLDDSENPTVDSQWKDFADSSTVAYELKDAGLYYAWVRDDKGILSRPMFAIVHDADITNTLKSLDVKDANDVSVTLNSIEGENAYLDVMPSGYSLLSNRLKNDTSLAGFDALSMGYKIEVNSSKISVFATLTSDDASYVEGYEPRTVDLDYGENKILIKIKNKDGKVRTYTIIATRTDERVSNNLLSDLTVSKGKIEFDPYVTDYDISVPKNTKKVSINATLASDTSSFVEGHEPREVELNDDITTQIIEVLSESGITRSYVLTFTKSGAEEDTTNSAYLDSLSIAGTAIDFNKEIYEYSVTVPYEYSSVNVYAFPESDNAFAEVLGDRGLKVGPNNVKITVTNGKLTKTYNVTVNRKEAGLEISNDVTLSSLTIKNYGIDFSPDKLDYVVKIKREKSLIITATPTSNRSQVYMYGNNSLTGFSTVRIKVVAENGATNIYSIDIQKDSYNKALEITAAIIGGVLILGAGIIIVVRKKNKKMKEYLGK